ncbi:MAG: gliding motility-associated C-terminal domain-containing protein, partial [Chitinophagaceae bacterium]|nr:gliding motility-associated C-terminal domain-containing protein [Chitinophagaceae bacterium]
ALFNNASTGGVRYKWIFGDGEERIKTTNDTTLHQYNATGTYNVMLVTFNQYDCTDTAFATVNAWVDPLLDVPNAFTPGRGGRNSTISVQGFGINTMTWKIYNRNGQKVFETNTRHGAWDGTFRGQLQPMDVYVYTLEVQFTDGRRVTRTGDITLIR